MKRSFECETYWFNSNNHKIILTSKKRRQKSFDNFEAVQECVSLPAASPSVASSAGSPGRTLASCPTRTLKWMLPPDKSRPGRESCPPPPPPPPEQWSGWLARVSCKGRMSISGDSASKKKGQ